MIGTCFIFCMVTIYRDKISKPILINISLIINIIVNSDFKCILVTIIFPKKN